MTPDRPPRSDWTPAWIGASLFAAVLAVYVWTLAPGLVRGDGAELQFTLATLGVAHPTGYPLYTLLGWLWARLIPAGTIAWRLNLLSAVAGAGAVALAYAIGWRLTRRLLPALAGAAFLAFSTTFWTLSSVTEVYALHQLFVAATLYLLFVWRDAGPRRPLALAAVAFVYGLSLSHHRTMVLLAPAMLFFVAAEERPALAALFRREGRRARIARLARRSLVLAVAFAAGLLPYAHIFIQQLGRGRTVQHVVWNVILGGDFVGFLGLRPDPGAVLWELPVQQVGPAGLVLAAAGLAWLVWRRRTAAGLLGLAWAANTLFCLFYRVPDIPVFLVPSTLVVSICAGLPAGWVPPILDRLAPDRFSPLRRRAWQGWLAVAEALVLLAAVLSIAHLRPVQAAVAEMDGDVERQARDLLAYPFPPDSTVIVDWDLAMATRFLRGVEGLPAGVRVNAVRLGRERGCDWLAQALDAGGAVYVHPSVRVTRLPDGYQFEEAVPLIQITRRPAPYVRLDRPLDARLTLEGVQRRGSLLVLRWRVGAAPLDENYTTYAHFFDAAGRPLGQQDKGMGEATCWYPPTTWPPRQVVQDLFFLPAGTASVRAGLYALRDGQVEPLGSDTTFPIP